jgi:putative serine protease PepD
VAGVAALASAVVSVPVALLDDDGAAPATEQTAPTLASTSAPDGVVAAIAADVSPSVVRIDVASAAGRGAGSGVIYSSAGHIITNAHVVGDRTEVTVTLADGESVTGEVLGADPMSDIAVVRIAGADLPGTRLRPGGTSGRRDRDRHRLPVRARRLGDRRHGEALNRTLPTPRVRRST